MIKIDFEYQTKYGVYKDALHLPDSHGLEQSEIEAIKQQRLDKWLYIIENPTDPEPEIEIVELDGISYEKTEADGKLILTPIEE